MAAAYRDLATSPFFDRVKDTYGDRIFGFYYFTISRTPEENARMLLEALPEQSTTFDVISAHSRGGLVLRNLVERAAQFGDVSRRFSLGRAVLVASPNEGTPLVTPKRWDDTIGWLANLLEVFPDNPFTTGAEFVANSLVWLANHAAGDLPGLRSMDGDGEMITAIQTPPGPPPDADPRPWSRTITPRTLSSGVSWTLVSTSFSGLPTISSFHRRVAGASIGRERCSFRRRGLAVSDQVAICPAIL